VKVGLVGSSVSIAFVFIFWNTFKVHILELFVPFGVAVAPGASCSLDESYAFVDQRLTYYAKCDACQGLFNNHSFTYKLFIRLDLSIVRS
jgi:hypothetical protein